MRWSDDTVCRAQHAPPEGLIFDIVDLGKPAAQFGFIERYGHELSCLPIESGA